MNTASFVYGFLTALILACIALTALYVSLSPEGHPKSPTCGHLKIPHQAGLISQ